MLDCSRFLSVKGEVLLVAVVLWYLMMSSKEAVPVENADICDLEKTCFHLHLIFKRAAATAPKSSK